MKFKTAFLKDLSQRIAKLNHEWFKMATVLDPRFNDLKCPTRVEREEVWTSLEALLQGQSKRDALDPTQEPAKMRSLLLSSVAFESDSDDEVGCTRVLLSLYRAEPTIIETTSHCHCGQVEQGPTHSCLSWPASPATSVKCERLFSLAGHIATKKRAALSSENMNRLVCLSNWLKKWRRNRLRGTVRPMGLFFALEC